MYDNDRTQGAAIDILIRIKRLIIARRVVFTLKADDEMAIDGLTREIVYEALLNAPMIIKKLGHAIPIPANRNISMLSKV